MKSLPKVDICNIEYKGRTNAHLEKGYQYSVVLIDYSESQSEEKNNGILQMNFVNPNMNNYSITYNTFFSFALDWDIISLVEFKNSFLPIKRMEAL